MGHDSTMKTPSGKFVLRLEPSLHKRLKNEAAASGLSLNQWVTNKITDRFGNQPDSHIVTSIQQAFGSEVEAILVFGSAVRGELKAGSDLDLLVVVSSSLPVDRSLYRRWDKLVEPVLGHRYSPQFSHLPNSESASSLWLEVALEGKILYDKNDSVHRVLALIRKKIASGQFTRKESHGHPYWVKAEKSAK